MKIYNYEHLSTDTNATITITVRTDKGREVADFIAEDELNIAFAAAPSSWYVENVSEEDY
jgi:hypothetical protein